DQRRGRRRNERRDVAEVDDRSVRGAQRKVLQRREIRLILGRIDDLYLFQPCGRLELRGDVAAERGTRRHGGLTYIDAERLRFLTIELDRNLGCQFRAAAVDA